MHTFKSRLIRKLVKRWNLPGYKRFWYIFSTYARSYWKCFVGLLLLNITIFVLGMLQTAFTGATITALTGSSTAGNIQADQLSLFDIYASFSFLDINASEKRELVLRQADVL